MIYQRSAPTKKALFLWTGVTVILAMSLPTDVAFAQEEPKPVAVTKVQATKVHQKVRLNGSVMTPHYSQISSEVSGLLNRFDVDEGDYVESEETLCSLDPTVTRLELAAARADLAGTKARLAESRRLLKEDLGLSKENIVPQTELDAKRAQVKILKAKLRQQKAETNRIHELLARHKIKSPFAGIVGEKKAEIGEWVGQGSSVLTLVAIDPLRARFNVPENHYNRISTNTTVKLEFDALPNKTTEANVTKKVGFGDLESRTFPVRIEFSNPEHRIIPGMSCEATFLIPRSTSSRSLVVPSDAIVLKPDDSQILWRLKQTGKTTTVESLTVQTGLTFDGKKEVISDRLTPEDRVVTRGNETLQPDTQVRVVSSIPAMHKEPGQSRSPEDSKRDRSNPGHSE